MAESKVNIPDELVEIGAEALWMDDDGGANLNYEVGARRILSAVLPVLARVMMAEYPGSNFKETDYRSCVAAFFKEKFGISVDAPAPPSR